MSRRVNCNVVAGLPSPPNLYMVAVSQKEAESVARLIGHRSLPRAEEHLRAVKAPPTDPCYHYKIFKVIA